MLHRCSMLERHPAPLPTPRTLCRTRLPVGCPPAIPTAPLLPCLLPAPRTAQLKPDAYTGTGLTQDYQHGASSCLLLQHPLWAMSPVLLAGGHGASEIAGVPSAVPRWDLQQDPPYGCHGQGVLGQTETGQVEDGGGQRGALLGQGPGAFPARGAPEFSRPFSICPGHPAAQTRDKVGDRHWPHGGGCQHRALQVSL